MPGYCVQGTVGHKILSGQRKLEMEGRQMVSVPLSWLRRPPRLSVALTLSASCDVTARGEDAGGVHVIQCPC